MLVLAGLLYWHLRREWIDSHARDLALLNSALPAARVPGLAPLEKVDPVTAADFADVATKNLFSQDRNPNVIVDPPQAAAAQAAAAFPVAHGVMLWDGVPPTIVLSEKAGGAAEGLSSRRHHRPLDARLGGQQLCGFRMGRQRV